MTIETQDDFSGGLNNRLPAHKIPPNAVQVALDSDFSHGDIRADTDIGGSGGGSEFFYEAGKSWIGKDGVGSQTGYEIITYTANTTVSSNLSVGTPLIVSENVTLEVNDGNNATSANVLTVHDVVRGLATAQSFVEYADDLYIGRDSFEVDIASISNGVVVVTVASSDIYKFIVGDELSSICFTGGTTITEVDVANSQLTLSRSTKAAGTNVRCQVKATPIRFIDGDIQATYRLGISQPEIGITLGQLSSQNTTRTACHSTAFFAANPPVVFQYGIARFDGPTLAESGISELSDLTESSASYSVTDTNSPLTAEFNKASSNVTLSVASPCVVTLTQHGLRNGERVSFTSSGTLPTGITEGTSYYVVNSATNTFNVATTYGGTAINTTGTTSGTHTLHYKSPEDGKYAVYRVGGTSAILKKYGNLYYKDAFTVAVNVSGATVTFTPTNTPAGASIYARFFSYDGLSYSEGTTHNATNAPAMPMAQIYLNSSNEFKLTTNSSAHRIDIIIYCTFPDTTDDRTYVLTGDTGGSINVHGTGYTKHHIIDFTPARSLIDIEPIQDATLPEAGLKHLVEINNFFFGALGKRLHVSSFGRPNNWPVDGFLDFDSNITGLRSRGGECIVFTEFGIFRVYGNTHNGMRKVRVPTTEGVVSGLHKCIAPLRDGIVYVSHSGISLFNGRDVQVLTQGSISDFVLASGTYSNNTGGVIEDVYYVLAPSGEGWKVDFRFGTAKISKTTINADHLWYRGLTNKIYSSDGFIGGGNKKEYEVQTRDFALNDINVEKVLNYFLITGSNFKGNIELYADGVLRETFSIPTEVSELNRAFYPAAAIIANRFSIKFTRSSGKIQSVSLDLQPLSETPLSRFDNVLVTYTGTPTIGVKVDNVSKITATTLSDPGVGNTGTAMLYFPASTEGHIVHYNVTETETDRLLNKAVSGAAI